MSQEVCQDRRDARLMTLSAYCGFSVRYSTLSHLSKKGACSLPNSRLVVWTTILASGCTMHGYRQTDISDNGSCQATNTQTYGQA